jgi:hypothetical protein
MKFLKLLSIVFLAFLFSGCISSKTYVDPSFGKANYADIKPVSKKYITNIIVEFQRNGKHLEIVDKELSGHVERTLRASGIIVPGPKSSNYSIKVVVNNIADIAEARAKGIGTGLTFGAAGSLVSDYYEAKIEFIDKSGNKHIGVYEHALHTTVGNKKSPFSNNTQPTTLADGFGTVVEQMLLNFLADMQRKNILL